MSALLKELVRAPDAQTGPSVPPLQPGSVVGRFEILREIGRGGFGAVYEARDRELGRLVAFKAIRPGARVRSRLGEESLQREAETAAQLTHPNVATLYDAGRGEHGPYLVFELLEGETLRERLARGPLPVRDAVRIAIDVAHALAYAHAAGVVHCDLKPSNVFLTHGGGVKVLDFGLARVFGESRIGSGGTPAYMAPEQWRGEREDSRADVFALGAMLYEMLSGSLPFEATRDRSSALDPGPPPPLRVPGAGAKVVELVAATLSKDPAGRPRNGQAALEALLEAERDLNRPEWRLEARGLRLCWRDIAIAAVVVLAVGTVLTLRSRETTPPERTTVAVADFANETGDPELDGLSGLLITSLEQSRRLSVLTRSRMLDVLEELGKGKVQRIDEPLAREVGRHVGARALMFASIRRFDGVYAVEMKALDPIADAYLFTVQEQAAGKSNIPGVVDRLSERARRALRESAEEVRASEVKVADAVTGSLEAYRHYFLGVQCVEQAPVAVECVKHFKQALAVDPTFALAQYRLAYEADFDHVPASEQRAAFDDALRHADRFPMKERLLMQAWKSHVDGDDAAALTTYRRLAADYPQDKEAAYLLGDLLFHREDYDYASSIPWFEKAVELDPGLSWVVAHLVEALAAVGRADEIVPLVSRWGAQRPGPLAWMNLALAYARIGQIGPALEWMRRAAEAGLDEARYERVGLLMLAGDYEAAERESRLGNDAGLGGLFGNLGLAAAQAYQGKRREALRTIDSIPRQLPPGAGLVAFHEARIEHAMGDGRRDVARASLPPPEVRPPWLGQLAMDFAYLGDFETAAELDRALARGSPYDRLYRAVLQWRTGDAVGAADRLDQILREAPWVRLGGSGVGSGTGSWFHAEALFEAGRYAEAVDALRRFQGIYQPIQRPMYRSWAYPKSLYLLARSYEELGQRENAREEIEKLLAMWKDADPDLPLLADARALRARLAQATPAKAR